MYISLQELGFFLAAVIFLIVGGFLLVALAKINRLVTYFNRKLIENDQHVQGIIENLKVITDNLSLLSGVLRKNEQLLEEKIPDSINNLYTFTATLKDTGERVSQSLEIVHTNLAETAATVTESAKDLLAYVKVVSEGIRIIIKTLMRK
ncbi:MAG: hypothetical protein KGZ54_10155 [Dethiobacter sp.]|jgi:hypothetical protein|nr:hypothetical protein [Dethiobacter sp.]MBS3902363.1 hypothetical protein [Dethiobacter sp.]